MTQATGEWERAVVGRVAGAIRDLRDAQKMSAQKLSDRLGALGLDMSRASISALENGTRPYVTITELMLFARALNTSPIALIYPGPYRQIIDVLPGADDLQIGGVRWFCGADGEQDDKDFADSPDVYARNTAALRHARRLEELWAVQAGMKKMLDRAVTEGDSETVETLTRMVAARAAELAELERDGG